MKRVFRNTFGFLVQGIFLQGGFLTPEAWGQASFFYNPVLAGLTTDGNSYLAAPFFTTQAARFEQVYSASTFSGPMAFHGGWIRAVVFRLDAGVFQNVFATVPSVQLYLSTTPLGPDNLSGAFDNNLGADNSLVLGPTSVTMSSFSGGGSTGYDLAFAFPDHPFFYNPANGNLLLDLQILAGAPGGPPTGYQLDAFDTLGDGVSSVVAYGSTLPTTGQASTIGLATAFSITPVPEPSTWLFFVGLGTMWVWRRLNSRKGFLHVTS